MTNKLARTMLVSLVAGTAMLGVGCADLDSPDTNESSAALESTPSTPASALRPAAKGMLTFVSFFSDATLTQLVGTETFDPCNDGDPRFQSWGATTSFYIINSVDCSQ